jgi:hypothetical protein
MQGGRCEAPALRRSRTFDTGRSIVRRLVWSGVSPAALRRAESGHSPSLSFRFHVALCWRSTGRQGSLRVLAAQRRIGGVSVGAECGGGKAGYRRRCFATARVQQGPRTSCRAAATHSNAGTRPRRRDIAASARAASGRIGKAGPAATRCGSRGLPLRFQRALPRRKARRICGSPLSASQCAGAVSGMQKRRDGDGRGRPAATRRGSTANGAGGSPGTPAARTDPADAPAASASNPPDLRRRAGNPLRRRPRRRRPHHCLPCRKRAAPLARVLQCPGQCEQIGALAAQPFCYFHNSAVASFAPSASVASFAHAICGWIRPPNPQSVPAMTFSRPTTLA